MKKNLRPILLFVATLVFLLSIPHEISQKMRYVAISLMSPPWQGVDALRSASLGVTLKRRPVSDKQEALSLENRLQKEQIQRLRAWLLEKEEVDEQKLKFKQLNSYLEKITNKAELDYFEKKALHLADLLQKQLQAVPAQVIFREPALWGTTLWVNVGERENRAFNRKIISLNSPVVVGEHLVGVVEEVFETKSRIRLITDSSLTPSVCVVRGTMQDHYLTKKIDEMILMLSLRMDLKDAGENIEKLALLKKNLQSASGDIYLARGQMQGASTPLWRSYTSKLKGVGFHDLATDKQSLMHVGDLLMTSGMDGVFPPHLIVGQVTAVLPLREGSPSYEIEAQATAPSLEDLKEVFILPPID